VKPPPVAYARPASVDDALDLLATHDDAAVIAGGQSLVPMLNLRLVKPTALIDINGVDARPPEVDGDALVLPAMTRHVAVVDDLAVRARPPMLAEAVRHVGNVRVRHRGTIGGSLAHADPTSEIAAVALCLDAQIVCRGQGGGRTIAADDFFVSYLTTVLGETDIVTELRVPMAPPNRGWSFQEMARRVSDFAVVAVAATVDVAEDGTIVGASVALSGVADRVRAVGADVLGRLVGVTPSPAAFREVGVAIAATVDPASDGHASGAYRRRLVEVLSARALSEAAERAVG
jgi:CO/xanthine dehydrogenase FAD-binding subunit